MLIIKDLSKIFGNIHVLKNINLSFQKGHTVSIIGPSGSGKSTLLRCIAMLEELTSGIVIIDGHSSKDTNKYSKIIHKKVGMVFQHFHLFNHLNVFQNLILAPRLLKQSSLKEMKEKALKLLDRVGLQARKDAYPQTLSGGEKQRIAIIRMLMMDPEILLFDEPTSSLDPEMVREVLDVIQNLQKDGLTIILVSHAIKFVEECSNHVIFMDHGEIIEQGSPKSIFQMSKHTRTTNFLSKIF